MLTDFCRGVPGRWLVLFWLPSLLICYRTTVQAGILSWKDDRYNYTLALLAIIVILFYQERKAIA